MDRQHVSLCLIARDEQELLPRCLDSARPYVDEIVLADTGSSDRTREIAAERGARVIERPWRDDFSAPRNAALRAATGRWVLALDADEWIEGGATPEAFQSMLAAGDTEAWNVTVRDWLDAGGERSYALLRVFRNRPEYRYEGAIHEQIGPSIARFAKAGRFDPADSGLTVGHDGYRYERRMGRGKAERNLRLLRKRVAADPGDAAARYFLIRERVPMRGGRAVPGSHLHEAIEHCEALGVLRDRLAPGLQSDLRRLHAAALLGLGRAEQAARVLDAGPCAAPHMLLRADAELAEAAERAALERLRAIFDDPSSGDLPFADPALTRAVARARAAETLLRLGRPDEARRLAREATGLPGGGAEPWRALARIEGHTGRAESALAACLEGARIDPHDPWIWLETGRLLLQLGAPAEARGPLDNAVRLAPGWDEAEALLAAASA